MMFPSDGEDSKVAAGARVIGHPAARCIAFGPFRVFPIQRLLTKSGKPIQLGSRAFDILVTLLERPGELVSKEALIARVWPSTFVDQANLAVQIGGLRRALDDGHQGNRYILNIPGRGYRFVAPVTIEAGVPTDMTGDLPISSMAAIAPAQSIENLEQHPQQRQVFTFIRSEGAGQARAALALVEKLLASHRDGLLVVGVAPVEES
jgi:DNA-binding winged helix-turn-helix (wHTH) protein